MSTRELIKELWRPAEGRKPKVGQPLWMHLRKKRMGPGFSDYYTTMAWDGKQFFPFHPADTVPVDFLPYRFISLPC